MTPSKIWPEYRRPQTKQNTFFFTFISSLTLQKGKTSEVSNFVDLVGVICYRLFNPLVQFDVFSLFGCWPPTVLVHHEFFLNCCIFDDSIKEYPNWGMGGIEEGSKGIVRTFTSVCGSWLTIQRTDSTVQFCKWDLWLFLLGASLWRMSVESIRAPDHWLRLLGNLHSVPQKLQEPRLMGHTPGLVSSSKKNQLWGHKKNLGGRGDTIFWG